MPIHRLSVGSFSYPSQTVDRIHAQPGGYIPQPGLPPVQFLRVVMPPIGEPAVNPARGHYASGGAGCGWTKADEPSSSRDLFASDLLSNRRAPSSFLDQCHGGPGKEIFVHRRTLPSLIVNNVIGFVTAVPNHQVRAAQH